MTESIEELVELPRRVVHQPTPELHAGGDCGACVLAGLFGLPLEEVYAKLHPKEKAESFSHYDIVRALRQAKYLGFASRYIEDCACWPQSVPDLVGQFGQASWHQSLAWQRYLTMAFEAGYYAIASVSHKQDGPFGHGTDHWVMLCGTRTRWEKREDGTGSGSFEVLVSCSSRSTPDEEWVGTSDFLQQRGGFNVLLARPVNHART